MGQVSVRGGEAIGLAARPGVDAVRLKLSLRDRACRVLRWVCTLAGAVVVLWFGAAFLAAAPAAAAVAVPVTPMAAGKQGLVKGGGIRPADGGDGDSDSGDSSDEGGSDGGGDSDGGDSDGGDSDEKESDEKESDERDSGERDSGEEKSDKKESDKKDSGKEKSDERDSGEGHSGEKETHQKDSDKKDSDKKKSDEKDSGEGDSGEKKKSDKEESDKEKSDKEKSDKEKLGQKESEETGSTDKGDRAAESDSEERGREEKVGERDSRGSREDGSSRDRDPDRDSRKADRTSRGQSDDEDSRRTDRRAEDERGDADQARENRAGGNDSQNADDADAGDENADGAQRGNAGDNRGEDGHEARDERDGSSAQEHSRTRERVSDATEPDRAPRTDADRDRNRTEEPGEGSREDRSDDGAEDIPETSEGSTAERKRAAVRERVDDGDERWAEIGREVREEIADRFGGHERDERAREGRSGGRDDHERPAGDDRADSGSEHRAPGQRLAQVEPRERPAADDAGDERRTPARELREAFEEGARDQDRGGEEPDSRGARELPEAVEERARDRHAEARDGREARVREAVAQRVRARGADGESGDGQEARELLEFADRARDRGADRERRGRAELAGELADRAESPRDRDGAAEERRAGGERLEPAGERREADERRAEVRRLAQRAAEVVRESGDGDGARAVADLVDEALDHAAEAADRAGESEEDARRVVATTREVLAQLSGDDDRPSGDAAPARTAAAAKHEHRESGGAAESERAERRRTADPRGPPSPRVFLAVLRESGDADDDADEEREYSDGEWADHDDSAEQTERVLEGRIEVDESARELEKTKKKVARGKGTRADYAKQAAEHEELERDYEAERAQVSPERAELVDEVVDGHRELSTRERQLAAEEKKVAAGTMTEEAHERTVAAFQEQRDEVYEATDELMAATDRDPDAVSEDELDGEGAVAGCGSSGVFVECGAATEGAEGEQDSDRCLALSGVSSGCGASSRSGDSEASASCTLTGADRGCGSSASSRGDDGETTRASAHCTGECEQHSRAATDGASAECAGSGGSCESRSSGRERDDGGDAATAIRAASAIDRGDRGTSSGAGSGSARCLGGECATSSSIELDEAGEVRAEAEVECSAGCTGTASSRSDAAHEAAVTGAGTAGAGTTGAGPPGAESPQPASATTAAADCTVTGGGCRAVSGSEADGWSGDTETDSTATVEVDCDGAAACSGNGKTATSGSASGMRAGADRAGTGAASCEVRGGECGAHSSTGTEASVDESEVAAGPFRFAVRTDGDASASSSAGASVDCGDVAGCTGTASGATTGTVTGTPARTGDPAPVRTTTADSTCTTTAGGCDAEAASEVADRVVSDPAVRWGPVRRALSATSTADAAAECDVVGCAGSGAARTSGAASGDVTGVRAGTGGSSCTVRGDGGGCVSSAGTTVADREPAPGTAVSGPVSVSTASASVECGVGAGECAGTAESSTSARDTAVSPHARGTSAAVECTVTGGGCVGDTSSAASSAPDFVAIDPATGRPLPGQPTSGPTSTASSSGTVVCGAGAACSGTVRTSVSAWDGGPPRTSTGEAGCAGTGGCTASSVSHASSGPGAALALSGAPHRGGNGAVQPVNAARLPAGPSAASAAGAAVSCAGEGPCDGRASSAAAATDPAVSPEPRGSRSEGSCEGVVGGVCQAVTNSGASSGPDANVIVPLVQARSTANAAVTSEEIAPPDDQQGDAPGHDRPAIPPAPSAPGSSANSGGPTVPGASSWTMASAVLDCAGSSGCVGTARTSATGSDGPQALTGAGGARGPPAATGTTRSSGSCASVQSGCHVRTDSSAGSGQVVADMVAEDRTTAAEQARAQAVEAVAAARAAAEVAARAGATAAERTAAADAAEVAQQARRAYREAARLAATPVTDAPATTSRSNAIAQCTGPACLAAITGGTGGTAGRTTTTGHCVAAAHGCTAAGDALASADRGSAIPGSSGVAQATSHLLCPDAGCTGTVTGESAAVAGPAGRRSTSTATGSARCDGTSACLARITASASRTTGTTSGLTSASVGAACADGTAAGCATRTSSRTTAVGAEGVRGTATATCRTSSRCDSATGGLAADAVVGTTAQCAGTGCRTSTGATARAALAGGATRATSSTGCTAGTAGACAGSSRVGATQDGSQAFATCRGTAGSACRHSYSSTSSAHSRTGGNVADAHARCGASGGAGGGWCATGAGAQTTGRAAVAMAACQGSAGSGCSHSYRARSAAAAASGGASARAAASGSGAGTVGGGFVATTASALARPGAAQATASCTGSGGVRCSHSYSAEAAASAAYGGNRASAYAAGSGGGGRGGGGLAVTAQASAGPGSASAGASCVGAVNCRHSYSAHAAASASYGGNWARAHASGSGGGGTGGGGVAVTAQASAGPGHATASASCTGAATCRWGYAGEASSSASYDDGTHRSWAHAHASGSGGGSGPGGGGLSVFAQAAAGKGWANAAAGCAGASNCSASYSSGAEASKTVGGQHAEAWARCSGGGTGGSCGSYATVQVDANNALAQAGCSGTGACDSHYATSSRSTGEGAGLTGDSGADCSGGGADGGYCATGSKVAYDAETGQLTATSYCATEGGTCSKYANIEIDASFQGGELTGDGAVHCGGAGPGGCSAVGVVKYHEATLDEEGNPVPPTLVVGTGCAVEGGTCSQRSEARASITGADGDIGATALSTCAGTTGWCSTLVGGEFTADTGEITAYAHCEAGGASACTKSEAHLEGEVLGPGQAQPDGPTEGTLHGNGNAHCEKTSGTCAVAGRFDHVPAAMGEDEDGDGEPDVVPAHVIAQTSCFPKGDHCRQEAHSWGSLDRRTEHSTHNGTAHSDCSGTWGSCSTIASVAYDDATGRVDAFAQCTTGDTGGTGCTRSSTHTYAWAESPHGEDLRGDGVSDCNQTGGFCSSFSMAKYFGDGERAVTGENGEEVELPAHVQSGAGCDTDGSAARCSYDFSAHGLEQLTGADGELVANAAGDCSDSGSVGAGWCSVAASATIHADERTAEAVAWCQGSEGVSCSYSAHVEAFAEAEKNNAESEKSCGASTTGTCSLAAAAVAAGGDREKQGQALASGFCSDTNGTCTGEFRTHVDSDRDTLSDCESAGAANGMCFGLAVRDHAMSGGRFFGEPDEDDELRLHSKAPGREQDRTCSAGSVCDLQEVGEEGFELDGEFFVLDVEEDKSVGQWFKNFGRDFVEVVVYAVPGLLDAVGTELWNTGKYDLLGFDKPEQQEGESDLEYYARLYPFTGGVATGAVNFYNRWINFEDGGTDWGRVGEDYYYAPFSTLLEDVGTVALVAVGVGAIIKGVSLGAKGAGAATAGVNTSMMSGLSTGWTAARAAWSVTRVPGLDAAFGATMRFAGVTGNLALAPLKVNFAAGRLAAGALSRGLVAPLAGRVTGAAEVAAGRAGAAFEFGRYGEAVAMQAQAARLARTGDALTVGAYAGRIIGRDGLFGRTTRHGRTPGLLGTLRAYDALGLRFGRTATAAEIASGHARASLQAFAPDALGAAGPRTPLGRLLGHERASALRQQRADRAHTVVRYDQLVHGGALRNPAPLSGRGVRAAARARVLAEIARGRLSPEELSELTRGDLTRRGLDELAARVAAPEPRETGAGRAGEQAEAPRGTHPDQAAEQGGPAPKGDQPGPSGPRPADPADPVLPSAPRGGDRLGGGQRPHSPGDGPDPVTAETGTGGGPRPRPEEPAPAQPATGHPTEPDPLTSDLPPPAQEGTPTGSRRDTAQPVRTEQEFAAEVAQVRSFWERFRGFTDAQLRGRFRALADDVRGGRKTIDEVAAECTALACEASRRNGKAPYDEQIAGALALVRGDLIQKLTGEGKTLAGSLAVVVRSLDARDAAGRPVAGRGVHWMALNPKAVRDAVRTVGPIAGRLGLTVGVVRPGSTPWGKRRAYEADIAVGTVSEFVFDALRARGARGRPVHGNRGGYRLIDEVDQVLLDEALTPHVLAAAVRGGKVALADLAWSARVATMLEPRNGTTPGHYEIGRNGVRLTPEGIAFLTERTGRDLTARRNTPLVRRVENALAFDLIVRKDVEYFVEDGRIVIVDKHGQRLDGRRWNDGLHEAIEYAENLAVGAPTRVLDSMTVVDFLGDRPFAGMTGTAGGEAGIAAFRREYGKSVVEIKPHRGRNRTDRTVTYWTAAQKWDGIFDDVVATMRSGRPVLVVTGSILEATRFSLRLRAAGIDHNLLTAKTRPAVEDRILADAGRPGQVTVATNKAGRGVDIRLGGAARGAGHDAVNEAGGLHVVLTEFPESLRIEDQARGRAGRQGENGSSTLHRSLEDPVLQPVGRGELAPARTAEQQPLAALDSAALDGLFTLARQEAEPAAQRGAQQQARVAVEQRGRNPFHRGGRPARPVLGANDVPAQGGRSAIPANPAGIDLPQLAALRAGQELPGLSAAEQSRLREPADRFAVEHAPTNSAHAAAARTIAQHLPQRTFQPYRYTEADLAAVAQRLAWLTQQATAVERGPALRERLGMDADTFAATTVAAAQLLADREKARRTGTPAPERRIAPAERLRLTALSDRELQALLDYARGLPEARIAERLGVPVGELGRFLGLDRSHPGSVIDVLSRATGSDGAPGRQVRTESATRDAVLARVLAELGAAEPAAVGTDGLWQRVRDELRAVELYGLHPAEAAALWQRADRIEEFIGLLPERHRDRVYATLVGAGITSVSQLAGMAPADLGLTPGATRAVRRALAATAVPPRADTWYRHRAVDLAGRTDWTHDDLLAALHVAAGLPYDPAVPSSRRGIDELRALLGLDVLNALADVLLARARAGRLGPADRAAFPVEALDVLVRARSGALTEAELAELVTHASGALRLRSPGAGPTQRMALLLLDAHVHATRLPQVNDPAPAAPARRSPAGPLAVAATATGAAGGGAAVLAGGTGTVLAGATVAGAVLGAAVVAVVRVVRNRGPPAAADTPSPAAADGPTVRRWIAGAATVAATRRRWAAARELRSVLAGLDEPVRAARSALETARTGLVVADAALAGLQRGAVSWLYRGPDAWSAEPGVDAARAAAVARVLGLDPAEVRLHATAGDLPGTAGLGEPIGSFDARLDRVRAELPALRERLLAAVEGVEDAHRALGERQVQRRATLEVAVRAAAAGGVPVSRIAVRTGLTPAQVRAIVGDTPGGGSGPSATGGGPGTGGGGGSSPSGTAPERSSTPPSGSGATAELRTAGPRAAGAEARSRGPPWWKRVVGARAAWSTVLVAAGLAAALVAIRYGIAEPGVAAAAGLWWWPGQRRAARELRQRVADARAALPGAEQAEAGARDAVRLREQELQARLAWVPALADRLRGAGRTDEQIVDRLADALSVHPARVRARLVHPDLAGAGSLPAELAGALPVDELPLRARDAVAARSGELATALVERDAAAHALDQARRAATQEIEAAAVTAREAGVRVGTARRATGLPRADLRDLQAPTLRDAAREVGQQIASGWGVTATAVREAAAGVGRGWQQLVQGLVQRLHDGRVLRAQLPGVARLRATVGVTARLLHRAQRATARSINAEQRGWIQWLAVVNSARPAGERLTEAELAVQVARALRLSERATRRLLAQAVPARAPEGVPETGIAFDRAVVAVAQRFAEAHPAPSAATAAYEAARTALRAGRDEAERSATGAGVAPARAAQRVDRAARGRGWAGSRARLRAAFGMDVPVAPRLRPRRARIAGVVTGAGVGLVAAGLTGVVGAGAVPVLTGAVVAAAGLLAAARAVWAPAQARAPPGQAFARGLRAHGARLALWALGGSAAVLGARPLAGLLERLWPVFVDQPGLLGVKALLVPAITAGLVFRYVLRRQHANQGSGMQTRPRAAAWGSAVAAYVITAGFGLVRAFQLVTGPWWLVPVVMAVAAGIAAAILQQKDTGRTRVNKSFISGSLSAAVAFAVGLLGTGLAPGALGDLVNAVVIATLVYASPTVIAEYVNVWFGRIMAPRAKKKALQARQNAAAADGNSDRQRRWYVAWLDYRNFSPVDTRLLRRKALDPVLAGLSAVVINLSWVERTWVLANDTSLTSVLLRFAGAATAVWLFGKLWRDPDEVRNGFYGFRSSRTLRSPSRAPWWTRVTGGRLHHRATGYQRDLDRVLEEFGLSRRPRRDRGLAHDLADKLWARMTAAIHEPLEEWESPPATGEIGDALARARDAAQRRRDQHVETIQLVVPILAADPTTLVRVAGHLRRAGRTADARVVDFQRMLAQELRARFVAAQADPDATQRRAYRVWAARLAEALAERTELRGAYLDGPRRELLVLIKQYHLDAQQPDHPDLRRARAELRALEFERTGASRPRGEPLEAVAQLADQRARSVGDAAVAEERALAAHGPAASRERLAQMRQLEAAMRLLRSAALLAIEAEHDRTQRNRNRARWRDAMARATAHPPNPVPVTLLERLLVLAGQRAAATAAQLEAQYGGLAWAETLDALAGMGALEGDASAGYRATAELAAQWRAAGPRLRRAVRSGAVRLPGGAALDPLTHAQLGPAGVTQRERDAVAALHDVLRDGDLAFRHWQDGWLDDARGAWRRLTGLGHRMRHPEGRRTWPLPADHPAAPVRLARGVRDLLATRWQHGVEPGRQRRMLRGHLRAADTADRLYARALRAGEFLADQRPGQPLRPEATDLLHTARAVEVEAYAQLAEAHRSAAAALDAVGASPHQVDRALRGAEEARPHAPGADPLPPTAAYWMKEVARELDAVRVRLEGLPPGPERDAALAEARLVLERHAVDREYAWAAQLHRTMGGWKLMETARAAATALRAAHPGLFRELPVPAAEASPVIPQRNRVEQPYGDDAVQRPGAATSTHRGRGNRTNQDAATLVTLANGDRVALVVDGVFSYPAARAAAIVFATAFRTEIGRTDRAGRSPAAALADAHEAGLDALTTRYTPETGHAAVAYAAAYHGADGWITTSHVGTARAYFLPRDPAMTGAQGTVDHSRGGDITDGGIMTRWAASDYRPAPTISPRVRPRVPGLVVLATDGLWRYLPAASDLAAALSDTDVLDPALAARRLAEAARRAGGRDDLTVAVVQAPGRIRPGPGGTRQNRSGRPAGEEPRR